MRSLDQFTSAAHFFLAILALGFLWYQWRMYRVDALRQRLFAERDKLFDMAADGLINFDNPAYELLRWRLNGMIRFAHHVTFARWFWTLLLFKRQGLGIYKEWMEALQELPPDLRKRLEEIDQQMSAGILMHMVSGSPVLIIFLGFFVLLASFSVMVLHLWELASRHFPGLDLLEAQAMGCES